jgi:5-oxoprolinase (ATP-hydrolysing) subunit C
MTGSAALRVDDAGPATSVQDKGRFGAQRYGLGTAGAMDRVALATGNALAGGLAGNAAVEIGPFAARFTAVGAPVRVAFTGAARQISVAGRPVTLNATVLVGAGETVSLGFAKAGVFTYMAVAGGIQARPSMGSLSVHQRAGLGSPYARPLKAGDAIPVLAAKDGELERSVVPLLVAPGPVRVVLGPQDDYFSADTIDQFLAANWRISAMSDRMGYRLEGPPLAHLKGANIVSDGIAYGAIQVPGNGQPLALLSDRGTTGGYPKIATIITADLGRFAQTPVGQSLRFQAVTVETAQDVARAFATDLASLPGRVAIIRDTEVSVERLREANVAGAAVSAMDRGTWPDET